MSSATIVSIAQIGVTIIGMFVGPWLAVRWSTRQFRASKWWEESGRLYKQLLEDLSWLQQQNITHLAVEKECFDEGGYRPAVYIQDAEKDIRQRLKRQVGLGSYLISDEAAKAIEDVLTPAGDDTIEYCEDAIAQCARAIDIIRKEASVVVKPKYLK